MALGALPQERAYRVMEYTTTDGVTLRLQVTPEVAAALADEGPGLREMTFSDLAGRKRRAGDDGRKALDAERMIEGVARRLAKRRIREASGTTWAGPRFHFTLLLGEGRPGWLGGETIDDRGRCGLCHDQWLPGYAYCLACDRCGRDGAIPTPGEQVRRRAPRPSRSRSGRKLAGGVGR